MTQVKKRKRKDAQRKGRGGGEPAKGTQGRVEEAWRHCSCLYDSSGSPGMYMSITSSIFEDYSIILSWLCIHNFFFFFSKDDYTILCSTSTLKCSLNRELELRFRWFYKQISNKFFSLAFGNLKSFGQEIRYLVCWRIEDKGTELCSTELILFLLIYKFNFHQNSKMRKPETFPVVSKRPRIWLG